MQEKQPFKALIAEETPLIKDDTLVSEIKKNPEVVSIHPFATKYAMLKTKDEIEGVLVKGLDSTYNFDHIREFNGGYNFFDGMSQDEIEDAQTPFAGWERETRAFAQGVVDRPPKWRDFSDPLDAISARFRARMPVERADGRRFSAEDRRALAVLKLDENVDRRTLRARYTELVRKFHPDQNGGDRSYEKALQAVVEAYGVLRGSAVFA